MNANLNCRQKKKRKLVLQFFYSICNHNKRESYSNHILFNYYNNERDHHENDDHENNHCGIFFGYRIFKFM